MLGASDLAYALGIQQDFTIIITLQNHLMPMHLFT